MGARSDLSYTIVTLTNPLCFVSRRRQDQEGLSRLLPRASSGGAVAGGRSAARNGLAAMAAPTADFYFPAGPVTRHAFIELLAADVVVTATPFIAWEPTAAVAGAPPRMGIHLALAMRAFISRCNSSPLPARLMLLQRKPRHRTGGVSPSPLGSTTRRVRPYHVRSNGMPTTVISVALG